MIDKLKTWLCGQEFYHLMQMYRHTPLGETANTFERYEAVKSAILEAVGKRTFIVTSVEHSLRGPMNYRVQLAHSTNESDVSLEGFSIPIDNLGPTLLEPGTRFTIEILND